ncbi:hypothetical protein AWV79_30550 [Cupriavidus sp. UYMMa02A]|nr:hypothetical protein AWV79_30550 [Cupriavidus sp. UYMMa02A]
MITLGNSVIITTVWSPHQSSCTTSSRRSSCSAMLSLKLEMPCVTALEPPELRRDIMAPWRRSLSITVADFWSARQRPKVTNHVCSSPAWYGSLMFSSISFQLAGMRWRE